MTSKNEDIEWSAPVIVRVGKDSTLVVELPPRVVEQFKIEQGDIVSFTCFSSGSIEVWSIKKGTYSSLEDENTKNRIAKEKHK